MKLSLLLLAYCVVCLLSLGWRSIGLGPLPSLAARAGATEWTGYRRPPVLDTARQSRVDVSGYLGRRIGVATEHFLLRLPQEHAGILDMLRQRQESPVAWKGVFPGQYLSSAQLTWRVTHDPALKAVVDRYVQDLVACQSRNGYLGPFPGADLRSYLDLWGHYAVMYGLLLHYQDSGYEPALEACRRIGDLVIETYGRGRDPLTTAFGANESISHALAMLYKETGQRRYLEMAHHVIATVWSQPGSVDYLRAGIERMGIAELPQDRWEGIHNLSTLAEMHWLTGDDDYRMAFEHLWWELLRHNRHSSGGFSADERVRGPLYVPPGLVIETCCTVAWIAVSIDMLRLTGDPRIADEIEWSTFNSALGSIPDGPGVPTYGNQPDGHRNFGNELPGQDEYHSPPVLNCCTTNANRAPGMIALWALMENASGLALNYYGPSILAAELPSGNRVKLRQVTDYPADGPVRIEVAPRIEETFALSLRIPRWSRTTRVTVNGKPTEEPAPGTYLRIRRQWRAGDVIDLEFDMRPRVWAGDDVRADSIAIFRGPLLYACDEAYHGQSLDTLPVVDARSVELEPAEWTGDGTPWSYCVLRHGGGELFGVVDFASAGQTGGHYRSWFEATNCPPPPIDFGQPRSADGGRPAPPAR